MSNPSKRKGSQFEADFERHLLDNGFDITLLRQRGTEDQGDAEIRHGLLTVAELKAEKRVDLPGYYRELELEKKNYAKHRRIHENAINGVVVVKRRMASIGKCWVVQTVDDYFSINIKD